MLLLKDSTFQEIIDFLGAVAVHGKHVAATLDAVPPTAMPTGSPTAAVWGQPAHAATDNQDRHKFTNNAAYEARKLKALYLRLYEE